MSRTEMGSESQALSTKRRNDTLRKETYKYGPVADKFRNQSC